MRWSVAAGLLLAVAGCADDGSTAERIADRLVDERPADFDRERARCVGERVTATVGETGAEVFADADRRPDRDDLAVLAEALRRCGVLADLVDGAAIRGG